MTMFSEMLREMDRNTIRYMVDDLKEKVEIRDAALVEKDKVIAEKNEVIAEKDEALVKAEDEITRLKALLEGQKED